MVSDELEGKPGAVSSKSISFKGGFFLWKVSGAVLNLVYKISLNLIA